MCEEASRPNCFREVGGFASDLLQMGGRRRAEIALDAGVSRAEIAAERWEASRRNCFRGGASEAGL